MSGLMDSVPALMEAASISSLKVTVIVWVIGTPVASLAGVVDTIVGAGQRTERGIGR